MSDVSQLLNAIDEGEQQAAEQLLPLVYDELRRLAAQKIAGEKGQTLDATGLVHEAYLRLVGAAQPQQWDGRGHFFAAAAEAMRRILIENARRKNRLKHGGGRKEVDLEPDLLAADTPAEEVLAVGEAMETLAKSDQQAADLVKLHYFAGLSLEQAGEVLGVSSRTAYRIWAYARALLYRELNDDPAAD